MSALMSPASPYRQPTIPSVVIPDLQDMERTGRYERCVLLWLQDSYVNRVVKTQPARLLALAAPSDSDLSKVSIGQIRQALIDLVVTCYAEDKAAGNGIDLKAYTEAATTFFSTEAARCGARLQELAESFAGARHRGVQPDVARHACYVYACINKLSRVILHFEGAGYRSAAHHVELLVQKGIKENERAVSDNGFVNLLITIGKNPRGFLAASAPRRKAAPLNCGLDFEPLRRRED